METTTIRPSVAVTPLYEQEALSQVTGGTLRPGGIALTTELLTSCRPAPGSTSLDVGCGPGHTVGLMTSIFGLRATGLDPSASMLKRAARNVPNASFLSGEATAIPCESNSFALVISECVLSLTGDIDKSLREMYRVLSPGGMLLLTDIYRKDKALKAELPSLHSCISHTLPLETIENGVSCAGFTLRSLIDRSELLKQLAGQIIFSYGSLEKFWQLCMGKEEAHQTCFALSSATLGYYVLIAKKGA